MFVRGWGPLSGHSLDSVLEWLGKALVYVAVLPFTAFPIAYARWFPWWKTTMGRAIMCHFIGMALLVDMSVVQDLWLGPTYPAQQEVSLLILLLVVVGVYWWVYALWKVRREGKNAQQAQAGHADEGADTRV